MNGVWTIARRELKALFDQPTGYILVVIFVGINNFLFFRQAYLFNQASLRPMLELMPWMFLFFIPAVTMRSLAEDVRSGTVEVVLAQPITELGYVLGKYLGQLIFVWFALALTLLIPVGLSLGADLHVGVVFAQYVGAALLAAGLVAVGMWASSQTKNQITAFIVGVAVMFLLVLVGLDPLLVGLPPALGAVAARLGVLSHFRDIARGVIDLRDAVYFVTLAAAFLSLAYAAVIRRKLSVKGVALGRLRMGVAIIVVGLVVINLFGRRIAGRLDLTPGKAYTLSSATKDVVRGVNDIVTLKLFVSEELPPEVALLRRDIDDLLRDYRSAGGDNIRLVVQDPSQDEEVASEARTLGIPPIQFNVVGESQFTVREGYLGLAIQHADETEVIPFIQRTDDLEYRLTSFIHGMSDSTQSVVGFYIAPSEQQIPGVGFEQFRQALAQTHQVEPITLTADSPIADSVSVLVLIGAPDSLTEATRVRLVRFFERGGSALVAASGMDLGQQQFAMQRDVSWNEILEPFGVSIRSDMVHDLLSNEQVGMTTNFGRLFRPYPLWIRALSTQANVVNEGIETVFLPWPSTIDTSDVAAGTGTALLTTSQGGGVETNAVMLDPAREFPREGLAPQLVATLVNPAAAEDESGPAGRVVVVGNSQFLIDRFVGGNPGNAAFALNAIDWLAQDDALIAIRAKNRTPPTLVFSGEAKATFVRWGNVFGVPLALILYAVLRLLKRRQKSRQSYRPLKEALA